MKKANIVIRIILILLSMSIPSWGYTMDVADDSLATEILVYVNQYRVRHGLSKLTMNPVLTEEATHHSRDMARHLTPFGHQGFSQRMSHLHAQIPASTTGAENVAYNYKTAKIVVDGWMKSPGHRQNILGHYSMTGIGIARDSEGKLYYTQLFLRAADPHQTTHAHPTIKAHQVYRHGHHAYS